MLAHILDATLHVFGRLAHKLDATLDTSSVGLDTYLMLR